MRRDLEKSNLYESVKTLVECPSKHIHLNQQKLFTLFSIAFQYLLYKSGKEPGAYIIRIENPVLAEKIAKKAKDDTSRKFMNRLLRTRKLRYEQSTFFLDYFNFQSWHMTADIPASKLKGAIVVQNTAKGPMSEDAMFTVEDPTADVAKVINPFEHLGEHYYLNMLKETCPKTLTIAYDQKFEGLEPIRFGFIPEPKDIIAGVKISDDLKFD